MQSRNIKTISIIGAGLSGLSAGVHAQKHGFKAKIFDIQDTPGGVLQSWKRNGYIFDCGIHYISGYRNNYAVHKLLQTLGVGDESLFIRMKQYQGLHDQRTGISFRIDDNLELVRENAKKLLTAQSDIEILNEIITGAKKMQGIDVTEIGVGQAKELETFNTKLLKIMKAYKIFKYLISPKYNRTLSELAKEVKAEWFKNFLMHFFYPDTPIWFIMMNLSSLAAGQFGMLKNGIMDFNQRIEKTFKESGGDIQYKANVTKILTNNNGKVTGIKLKDGTEHYSDYVISTCDGYHTIYNLLEGKYKSPQIDEMYKTRKIYHPKFMCSYGLNCEMPDENPYSRILLKNPIKYADSKLSFDEIQVRIMNYGNFAPKGKTVFSAWCPSDFDYWSNLRKTNRQLYIQQKNELGRQIIKACEAYYPGIASKVEVMDVATGATMTRYAHTRQGTWGGWRIDPNLLTQKPERTLPGLKNFYLAGHWALSTGAIGAFFSGKQAIEMILAGYNTQ